MQGQTVQREIRGACEFRVKGDIGAYMSTTEHIVALPRRRSHVTGLHAPLLTVQTL